MACLKLHPKPTLQNLLYIPNFTIVVTQNQHPNPRLALFTAEPLGHEVHREGFETSYNQNQNTSKYRKVQIIWSLCGYFFGSFDVKTLVRQIFVILYPHRDVHVLEWMETYHPTTRDAGKSAVN